MCIKKVKVRRFSDALMTDVIKTMKYITDIIFFSFSFNKKKNVFINFTNIDKSSKIHEIKVNKRIFLSEKNMLYKDIVVIWSKISVLIKELKKIKLIYQRNSLIKFIKNVYFKKKKYLSFNLFNKIQILSRRLLLIDKGLDFVKVKYPKKLNYLDAEIDVVLSMPSAVRKNCIKKRSNNLLRSLYLYFILIIIYNTKNIYIQNNNIKNLYTLKIFNYFNKHNFNYYFCKIKYLQDLIKVYILDKQYYKTYIYYYNLYLFFKSKYFNVILNFEDYKYEWDKILRPDWNIDEDFPRFYKPSVKEKKPARMSTDFYDYIKRKNRVRWLTKYNLPLKRVNESWNIVAKGPDNEEAIKKKRDLKNIKKHLTRHDNLYFFFTIYEFGLKLHDKLLSNYFNYDFFGITNVKIKDSKLFWVPYIPFYKKIIKNYNNKENEIKVLNSPYMSLSTNNCNSILKLNNYKNKFKFNINLIKSNWNNIKWHLINRKSNLIYTKSNLIYIYNTYFKKSNDLTKYFNTNIDLIHITHYRIKVPIEFFFLYTVYSIQHRRARYNLYVRSHLYFQEYFSKMYFFIWNNSTTGNIISNKYYSPFLGAKYNTFYSLSGYIELKWFNKFFFFYNVSNSKLLNVLNLKNNFTKPLFNLLLNNSSILNMINKKNLAEDFFDNYIHDYYSIQKLYNLYNGYYLYINKNITKFDKFFLFSEFAYCEYDVMVKNIYMLQPDINFYIKYIIKKTALLNYLNILININYINFYFLNDLFNLKKDNLLTQAIKSLNFYDKIFYFLIFLLDPFFFKYFYKKYFPKRINKIYTFVDYIRFNLLSITLKYKNSVKSNSHPFSIYKLVEEYEVKRSKIKTRGRKRIRKNNTLLQAKFNLPKFSFLMHYLYWKIDSSNSHPTNFAYSNYILQTNIAINSIYLQRFKDLANQISFLFQKAEVSYDYAEKYYYIMDMLKGHYWELLMYNIEFILLFFFLNIKKYSRLLLNLKINSYMKFIYSNFVYRYYIYNIWLESRYYDNWFHDSKKRIYWIYKKFFKHEGKYFYSKKNDII